jgi:hypothetical protein
VSKRRGLGGEMNQALYAHMNNKRKMKKKKKKTFPNYRKKKKKRIKREQDSPLGVLFNPH